MIIQIAFIALVFLDDCDIKVDPDNFMKTSPCLMSPHQLNPKNNSPVNDGQIMVLFYFLL